MSKVVPHFRLFLLFIFLSSAILLLDKINFLNVPRKLLYYLTNPISFGMYNTRKTIGKQLHFIFAARFAAQENKALKEQTGKLLAENAKLRKSLSETRALLSQQKYLDPQNFNLIPARPIGLSRFLRIDQGSSSGIKSGQAVVFENNFIGKIKEVSSKSANVELITDPDSKISAFSLNQDGKAKGVLIGQFGTELLLDKILHEEKIAIGDMVYSEGLEGYLARGLILGKITQVFDRENQVFKQAKVEPVFDISDLDLVFVNID